MSSYKISVHAQKFDMRAILFYQRTTSCLLFLLSVFALAFLSHMDLKFSLANIVAMHLFGTDPKAVHPDRCGRANQCRPVIHWGGTPPKQVHSPLTDTSRHCHYHVLSLIYAKTFCNYFQFCFCRTCCFQMPQSTVTILLATECRALPGVIPFLSIPS